MGTFFERGTHMPTKQIVATYTLKKARNDILQPPWYVKKKGEAPLPSPFAKEKKLVEYLASSVAQPYNTTSETYRSTFILCLYSY
jgi:hypothetical protein